ncbi:MAG: SPOR domain-containing protein [Spirochaetes bacterium]|nr:SPOR domain-containing protein [Spirochaetota bacterium]
MINDNDNKKYYAINLTEGRIWIIFILLLVLITTAFFVAVIIIKNNLNKNDNTLSYKSSSSNPAYFDYHGELGIEDQIINSENKINDSNNTESTPDELKIQLVEKKDDENAIKETKKIDEKTSILDDSEILYSSKYKDNSIETAVKKNTAETEKKITKQTEIKKPKTSSKTSLRYAVQVGSYEDKKLAEEISIYYKMQGYPAYLEQKNKSDKTFYRLRVGPFKEKNNAEKYLVTLKTTKYGKNSMLWEFKL